MDQHNSAHHRALISLNALSALASLAPTQGHFQRCHLLVHAHILQWLLSMMTQSYRRRIRSLHPDRSRLLAFHKHHHRSRRSPHLRGPVAHRVHLYEDRFQWTNLLIHLGQRDSRSGVHSRPQAKCPGMAGTAVRVECNLQSLMIMMTHCQISHLETAQESLHVPNKELPRYRRRIFHLPETNPPITTTIPTGQRDLTPLTCLEKVFHSVGHRLLHHQLKSNGTTPYIITPHHPTCLRQRPGCFTLLQHHNDKTTTINLVTGVVAMRAPLANRSTISTMH